MQTRKIIIAILFSFVMLFSASQYAHAEDKTVIIENGQFTPQITIIEPGDTVTWVNKDSVPHTSTSDDQTGTEAWGSQLLKKDQSYSKSFTVPGTYTYHCEPHPNMIAIVQVGADVTTPTPTQIATPAPTVEPTAFPTTSSGGSASINLTIFLNGIGKAGDSLRKNADFSSPKKNQRSVNISLFDTSNVLIKMIQTTVNYAATNGNFTGNAPIGDLTSGTYQVRVKADGFVESASQNVTFTTGQTITIPPLYLVAGDTNNDNQLNALDYNIILNCFGEKMTACQESQAADVNDDGAVNGFDYNLFLRELSAMSSM